MINERDRVEKIGQNESNQGVNQQSRTFTSIDLVEVNGNEESNLKRNEDSNDKPAILILDSNEDENKNGNVNRDASWYKDVNNGIDEDGIYSITYREQLERHRVMVDLDDEPEIVEISNNNSSNNIDDDLTIIEERNILIFHINHNATIHNIPSYPPNGDTVQ